MPDEPGTENKKRRRKEKDSGSSIEEKKKKHIHPVPLSVLVKKNDD